LTMHSQAAGGSMTESISLKTFREQLQDLMESSTQRPFVCDGSPLRCTVFVVGFNPATELDKSFWCFWDDEQGFNRADFMAEYLKKRKLKGVRPRIDKIVGKLPQSTCLETNICSQPTKHAADLPNSGRTTAVFEYLLYTIRPEVIYVHSDEPIKYFQRFMDDSAVLKQEEPLEVFIRGKETMLYGTYGPLFRVSYRHAEEIGRELNELLAERLRKTHGGGK
jgi:hypothetical protein